MEIPGYEDLTEVGSGGFSTVYRGFEVEFGRWVAIKVLDVGLDQRQRDAFQRECRAMGVVSQHPNIVTVLTGAFTGDGRPAIVMELYGGGTYAQRLRREGPLPATYVLSLGIRIGAALQSAHDRGLLHRDVKPQNLFVSDYGEPALGDFGISAFQGEDTTGGALTVNYAAPEILERQAATTAADVYALAATLYTLVAGRRPFARGGGKEQPSDVALRVLREPPPRIGGRCPPPLERAIMQGLAKRPEDRPASAGAFARLLQNAQEGLGIDRTELALARTVDDAELTVARDQLGAGPGAELDGDDSATVARPQPTTPAGDEAASGAAGRRADARDGAPPQDPSRGRSRRSLVLGGIAAAGVLGGVAWALGTTIGDGGPSGQDATEPAATGSASIEDVAPPVAVTPPQDVTVTRSADGEVVVSWSPSDRLSYEVERVDGDGDQRWTTDDGEVVVDDLEEDERPCVVVRAISEVGQVSTATPPTCAGPS